MPRSTSPRATASILSRKPVPVRIQKRERGAERKRILAAIIPTRVWKLATPQSPTIFSSIRGHSSFSLIASRRLDENFAVLHRHRIAAQLEDARRAGQLPCPQIEGEEMPRADDDIAAALALGERAERMRAARLESDIAAAVAQTRDSDLADAAHALAEDHAIAHLVRLAQGDRRHGVSRLGAPPVPRACRL